MLIHGTDDPLVPYNGGSITLGSRAIGGKVWSAKDTISFWSKHDRCSEKAKTTLLPDSDPNDGTRISSESFAGCALDTSVDLLIVSGGGHTWPSGIQYLPERFIGRTSKDIDATQVIWDFFVKHPKK
jgi:polyhydroxybutyrate depolymerase